MVGRPPENARESTRGDGPGGSGDRRPTAQGESPPAVAPGFLWVPPSGEVRRGPEGEDGGGDRLGLDVPGRRPPGPMPVRHRVVRPLPTPVAGYRRDYRPPAGTPTSGDGRWPARPQSLGAHPPTSSRVGCNPRWMTGAALGDPCGDAGAVEHRVPPSEVPGRAPTDRDVGHDRVPAPAADGAGAPSSRQVAGGASRRRAPGSSGRSPVAAPDARRQLGEQKSGTIVRPRPGRNIPTERICFHDDPRTHVPRRPGQLVDW